MEVRHRVEGSCEFSKSFDGYHKGRVNVVPDLDSKGNAAWEKIDSNGNTWSIDNVKRF